MILEGQPAGDSNVGSQFVAVQLATMCFVQNNVYLPLPDYFFKNPKVVLPISSSAE